MQRTEWTYVNNCYIKILKSVLFKKNFAERKILHCSLKVWHFHWNNIYTCFSDSSLPPPQQLHNFLLVTWTLKKRQLRWCWWCTRIFPEIYVGPVYRLKWRSMATHSNPSSPSGWNNKPNAMRKGYRSL